MEQIPQSEQQQEQKEARPVKERVLRPARPFVSRLPGMIAVAVATTVGAGAITDAEARGNKDNWANFGKVSAAVVVGAALSGALSPKPDRLEIKKTEEFKVELGARAEETMRHMNLRYDASSQKLISPNGNRLTINEAGRKNIAVQIKGLTNSQLQMDYIYLDQSGAFKQTSYVSLDSFNRFEVWKETPERISK